MKFIAIFYCGILVFHLWELFEPNQSKSLKLLNLIKTMQKNGKECTCIQWFWWIAGSRRNNPGFWSLEVDVEVTHEGWLAAAKVSNQTSSTESTGQPRQSNTVGAIFDCSNHFNRGKPALEQMLFNKMSELETRVKILLKSNKWASTTKQSLRVVVLAWCRKCPTEGKGKLAAWIDSDR